MGKLKLSPFSAIHEWEATWQMILSNEFTEINPPIIKGYRKDVIDALSKVRVIGGLQISRIFLNRDKSKLRKLHHSQILLRHSIYRGKMEIPIYTLGSVGLQVAGKEEWANQWYSLSEYTILKQLLFYQLFSEFKKEDRTIGIYGANEPYTGVINRQGKPFHVLVIRNNREEITELLSKYPKENIILICEHIDQLQPFNQYLKELNVRVTTDLDIKNDFKDRFYKWHNNQWQKESAVVTS